MILFMKIKEMSENIGFYQARAAVSHFVQCVVEFSMIPISAHVVVNYMNGVFPECGFDRLSRICELLDLSTSLQEFSNPWFSLTCLCDHTVAASCQFTSQKKCGFFSATYTVSCYY